MNEPEAVSPPFELAPLDVPYPFIGLTPMWALVRMQDGICFEGTGANLAEAEADARRRWARWRRLPDMHREYRRRMKARARRRR
jgi:hypothetical protein